MTYMPRTQLPAMSSEADAGQGNDDGGGSGIDFARQSSEHAAKAHEVRPHFTSGSVSKSQTCTWHRGKRSLGEQAGGQSHVARAVTEETPAVLVLLVLLRRCRRCQAHPRDPPFPSLSGDSFPSTC